MVQEAVEENFKENPRHYLQEDDVRGINKKILRNKGLTRHRKKQAGNARIMNKLKFQKAMVKQRVLIILFEIEYLTFIRVELHLSERNSPITLEKGVSSQVLSEVPRSCKAAVEKNTNNDLIPVTSSIHLLDVYSRNIIYLYVIVYRRHIVPDANISPFLKLSFLSQ